MSCEKICRLREMVSKTDQQAELLHIAIESILLEVKPR